MKEEIEEKKNRKEELIGNGKIDLKVDKGIYKKSYKGIVEIDG